MCATEHCSVDHDVLSEAGTDVTVTNPPLEGEVRVARLPVTDLGHTLNPCSIPHMLAGLRIALASTNIDIHGSRIIVSRVFDDGEHHVSHYLPKRQSGITWTDGRIRPGDVLLSINDQTFSGKGLDDAEQLLSLARVDSQAFEKKFELRRTAAGPGLLIEGDPSIGSCYL